MELNNKTCLVCGRKYSYCPNCAEYKNKPSWMTMFHDKNCYDIFEGICDYTLRNDIEKAKARLLMCDLTAAENMSEKNHEFIKEILGVVSDENIADNKIENNDSISVVENIEPEEKTLESSENDSESESINIEDEVKMDEGIKEEDTALAPNSFKRSKKKR